MAPILGIYASQISGHLFGPTGAYDSIATATVGSGGASSITFSSIPSTYTHLQLRVLARDNRSAAGSNLYIQFNSDSGANYTGHNLYGNGASPSAGFEGTSQTSAPIMRVSTNSIGSSIFAGGVIDILDYANTSKYKTFRSLSGFDDNAVSGGQIYFWSGLWMNSGSAISSLTITPVTTPIQQYSSFALYGIRGN
jgi:hypothetical protein